MNSDGDIKRGSPETLRALGFNIPLSEDEAERFSGLEKSTRLGMLAAQRHQELEASKVETRKEKFPGQSTAYLVGANR